MNFKHCAIRVLHPIVIKLAQKGCPLIPVERLFPLFVKPAKLNMTIESIDYKTSPEIASRIKQLHKNESLDSYFEEAKLLFQIVLSALAYRNPSILSDVRSIQFTVHVKDRNYNELIFRISEYIEKLTGINVTYRSLSEIPKNITGERITLSIVFNTSDDKDDYDAWRDLGYIR
jgi:hypothetical protein